MKRWYTYSSLGNEITEIQVIEYDDVYVWESVDWREEPFRWYRQCDSNKDIYVAGAVKTREEALAKLKAFNEKRIHDAELELAYSRRVETELEELSSSNIIESTEQTNN